MIKHCFWTIMLALSVGLSMSAAEPTNYYSSCEGKSGAALLSALYSVVGSHTTVSYSALWDVYKTSDIDSNGKIWDMYSTKRWATSEKCGSYSKIGDCYNREHSFPKSWFNDKSPMVSDAFHIYPTDGKVNGQRSNYPYGECSGGTSVASSNGVTALGKLGTCTFSGYTGTVFEPDDEYKGDFARSYFYMAAAYNTSISSWSSAMLAGNAYPAFNTWAINLLLKWHRQDPVSQKEIDRNEVVYGYQKNRNPFIDHPELAEYIWGTKTSESWSLNAGGDPELAQPVDGSTVDFGTAPTNYTISRSVSVRGANLTSAVTLSVNSSEFSLSTTSIPAATANGSNGAVSVTFKSSTVGSHTAVLTVKSGSLTSQVNLTATTVDGIPALAATQVDESSFMANWMGLDDEQYYWLNVMQGGASISGFPVKVLSEDGEYRVSGLDAATTYTYQLSSSTATSNIVSVTTATPITSITATTDSDLSFGTDINTPSDAAEITVDTENIPGAMTVTVSSPFEVSTDHTNWATSLTLQPAEERFYLRCGATGAGSYTTVVTIASGDYVNDELEAEALVTDMSTPWFVETFETLTTNSSGYVTEEITGSAAKWLIEDIGYYKSDAAHGGSWSLRLGSTNASTLTLVEPKKLGLGTISFYGRAWSDSEAPTIAVEYSTDGGVNWTTAGTCQVNATSSFQQYMVTANVEGSALMRLRQTAGKRANIDDITITDYRAAGIDAVAADENSWDAYALDGSLVITNSGAAREFVVYNLEGITLVDTTLSGAASYRLPAGLYIVTDLNFARRVLVK